MVVRSQLSAGVVGASVFRGKARLVAEGGTHDGFRMADLPTQRLATATSTVRIL